MNKCDKNTFEILKAREEARFRIFISLGTIVLIIKFAIDYVNNNYVSTILILMSAAAIIFYIVIPGQKLLKCVNELLNNDND